jgi:molybdopterin-guanine dinucleotide biosynthesis protein A
MVHADITLAILAGGQGRRLGGVAKGLLAVEGRPVLARLLALAPHFADSLLVAPDPAPYAGFAVRTVTDEAPGRGAPGGLCAALGAAGTPWVLAVACDMPFVSPAAVGALAGARGEGWDAVLFEAGGHWQPLLGLYRSALAGPFTARLAEGPSLRSLLGAVRTRVLGEDALRRVDARLLSVVGLNTPADLVRYGVERPDVAPPAVP